MNERLPMIIAYKAVFGSDMGKLVLADICRRAGVSGKLFTGLPVDVNLGLLNEGRRSLAIDIVNTVNVNIDEDQPVEEVNTKEPENG